MVLIWIIMSRIFRVKTTQNDVFDLDAGFEVESRWKKENFLFGIKILTRTADINREVINRGKEIKNVGGFRNGQSSKI